MDRLQEIESSRGCEAPAPSGLAVAPSRQAHDEVAAEISRGPDLRAVLGALSAVVYDWDIASDQLTWGANVGETLAAFCAASLATGAAFAELVAADSESSRFQAIHNASARDNGEGVPYRVVYRLAQPDRRACAVEDFGRWYADARGRPARAHGVLRVLQRGEDSEPTAARTASGDREGPLASRRTFNQSLEFAFRPGSPGRGGLRGSDRGG